MMRKEKQTTNAKEKTQGHTKGKHSGYGAVAAVLIAVSAVGYVAYRMVRKLFVPKDAQDPADAGAGEIPEEVPTDTQKDDETAEQTDA